MPRRQSSDGDASEAPTVSTSDLEAQIAEHEKAIADLRAQLAERVKQHYPKALYKAGETLDEVKAHALTCLDEAAALEAAKDDYVYENPAEAVTRA